MTSRAAFLAVLLAVLPLTVAAQTNPAIPKVGETIEVSIVNLDVVVTDRHGNRITGLTKDDFEVLEDGKPQAISNFSEYRSQPQATVTESSATAKQVQVAAPRQPRTLVIFFDDIKLGHLELDPVFAGLKKLLHEAVQPGDNVTIIRWSLHPVVVQQPTDDLRLVDATLDRIQASSIGGRVDEMADVRERIADLYNFLAEGADFSSRQGGKGAGPKGITIAAPSVDDEMFLFQARNNAEIALYQMKEKVKALNAIVTSMSGAEGKKALLIVSHRLGFYAGGESFFATRDRIPDSDRNRYDTTELVKSLTNNANAHGVTIYTMFPEGLRTTENDVSVRPTDRMDGPFSPMQSRMMTTQGNYLLLDNEITNLKRIADETGGTMAYSAVDIARMLPRVREDLDSYYSLAYRMGAHHDNKAHSVSVRPKNRDYRVRTRQHYFDSSVQTEMHDRVVGNLLRAPEASNIPIEVVVGRPEQKQKRLWSVPIEVRFPSSALTTLNEGGAAKGGFTIYVATGRLFGASADVTRQTVPFTVKPEGNPANFSYEFALTTDLLSDRISIAILDEVSHEKGFAVAKLPIAEARQ